ncbi:PAS domain S-box protein [Zeaxanthinibacter sp. PT1]|uniref:PAS domain S-box protein n=1 Tax=Zeaxanthinibacter TaxID=561554 RepID=UPI0023497567|nr:PAS domain S-box protein [Zeaxanthinibacter sp. PT1]MDC6352087.1 PAS domain S-box protein [Zeaxanthinibacter sp. PT1]
MKSEIELERDELIYNLPVAIYGCDSQGYIEFYNKAAATLWGKQPVLGKDRWCGALKILDLSGNPIDAESSAMAIAVKEERIDNSVVLIENHKGLRRYVIPNPQLRYSQQGKILGAVNTLIDITTQFEERKKIAENAKQFTTLANSIPNLAWMAHPDGSIYWYNQYWYDYTGTTHEEMAGCGWKSVHDPEHLPAVIENWERSIELGEPFEMIFPIKGANQKFRTFLTCVFPVRDEYGKVLHWFGSITDINEQKKYSEVLEAILLKSESQKEDILQFAPDAVVSINSLGRIISWNPEAENIFGWKEKEVMGKTLTETIIPDRYAQRHNTGMANYLESGQGQVLNKLVEVSAVKKSGEEIPIELKISVTERDGGEIFIGFIRDISQRSKTEEIIRNKSNQLIEAQKLAHIGSWEWDVSTNKVDWSDELYRIYGLVPQEIEIDYNSFLERIHPDDRDNVNGIVEKAFKDLQPFAFHHRVIHSDGSIRILSATGKVFTDSKGRTVKMTGTGQDVTEQKRKEAELLESEERFYKIFDHNPVPLSLAELKTNKITYVNNLFCSLFGYSKEEIIGQNVNEILFDSAEYERVVAYIFSHLDEIRKLEEIKALTVNETEKLLLRLKETDAMNDFEVKYTRKDGTNFPAIISFEVIHINSKRFTVTSYMDITERKKAEEILRKNNEELEHMNKELESFNYIASHDLQEPLRKIQLYADRIIELEYNRLSEKGRDQFNRMHNAARKMQDLIRDLLSYSRVNFNEDDREYINLNDIVEDIIQEFSETITEKDAIIEVGDLGKLKIFQYQFRQLVHNLIGNALKFSKSGIRPRLRIKSEFDTGKGLEKVELEPKTTYCHITFRDEGIGFAEEYSDRVFGVFQRLHGKNKYPGSGVGLTIVKKIVDNHNGHISVQSKVEVGSTFHIYIPVN